MDPVNRTGGARDTTAKGTLDRVRSARVSAYAGKTLRAPARFGPVPVGRQIRYCKAIAAATDCKAGWSASPQNRQHRRGQSPVGAARAYDYGERHRSGMSVGPANAAAERALT